MAFAARLPGAYVAGVLALPQNNQMLQPVKSQPKNKTVPPMKRLFPNFLLNIVAVLAIVTVAGCTEEPTKKQNGAADETTSAPPKALSTPDGLVFLTIDLNVQPDKMDEFLAVMIEAAPDTRAWEGCRMFDIYVDENRPGRVVFYEIWDTKEQQQEYISWRGGSGFNAKLAPFMAAGGGGLSYFRKVDG